jgi:TRAP-type mannitol/chloroaromatic compound transport system permease small subunit
MTRFVALVHGLNAAIGRAVSLFIYVMIFVIMYETLARYFFNAPTAWAHDVSGWLQVAYVFLGGAYALQKGYLVRVDVLYASLSPRAQATIDLTASTVMFVCFATVMIWKGSTLALQSFAMGETSSTGVWRGPVYPAKFMVPIGMGLLCLAWLARMAQQFARLVDPSAPNPDDQETRAG